MLPLNEGSLVGEPDFGLDADWAGVFDPGAGGADAGGKVDGRLAVGQGVSGHGKFGEFGAED